MNTNKQIQNAIKEILFATTAHKALSKSTGHNEKKKKLTVFSVLMCMDIQLIVIYRARMARKRCSFNETITYYTASNLNNCMAAWVCVFICVRETERGRQWQWGDRSACKCKQGSSTELYYSATIIIVLLNMHSIQTCSCRVCLWVQHKKDSSFREFLSFLVLSIST